VKSIRQLLCIVLATTMAAGCSSDGGVGSDSIRIGVSAEPYPPFTEKGPDGQWRGWEIDIGNAVCQAMNETCEIVEISWDGLIPALLSQKIDVIMASMSITEERMRTIGFSDKYYDSPAVLVAPRNSDVTADPATLSGKVIGVQVATIHGNYIEKYFADEVAGVRTYQSFDEHNQDLAAGRIDVVIGDSIASQPFLESRPGQCCEIKAELFDQEIFGLGAGFGLRKDDEELKSKLNAAIAAIRADGSYAAISADYFDFDIYGSD